MADMLSFKGFCSRAANGEAIRALYITPNSPAREVQQLEMVNEADARGLDYTVQRNPREIRIGDSVAYLRIAHPYLDREMEAHEFHWIHGLNFVEELLDGERIAGELAARRRL